MLGGPYWQEFMGELFIKYKRGFMFCDVTKARQLHEPGHKTQMYWKRLAFLDTWNMLHLKES